MGLIPQLSALLVEASGRAGADSAGPMRPCSWLAVLSWPLPHGPSRLEELCRPNRCLNLFQVPLCGIGCVRFDESVNLMFFFLTGPRTDGLFVSLKSALISCSSTSSKEKGLLVRSTLSDRHIVCTVLNIDNTDWLSTVGTFENTHGTMYSTLHHLLMRFAIHHHFHRLKESCRCLSQLESVASNCAALRCPVGQRHHRRSGRWHCAPDSWRHCAPDSWRLRTARTSTETTPFAPPCLH